MHRIAVVVIAALFLGGTAGAETLTLKDCLLRAAATNRGLKAASFEASIAQEQVQVARSAQLPRVDLQAGYTAQQAPQAVKVGANTLPTQEPDFAFLSFYVYQTLYDFGRTKDRVEQAKLQRDAAQHAFSGSEQELFLQVVRAYYGILAANKLVQAAEDEVSQMSSHQNTAQAFFEEGVVTRNDLLQAEVRVAASRQKLLAAQNAVDNGWLLLDYLIGAPPQFRSALTETLETGPLPAAESGSDFSKRGELVALRDAIAADDFAVREAKTLYYPELFARLGFDYVQNEHVREPVIMSATLGLRVNLYDGLATTSRVRQAVKIRSQNEERLKDLEARLKLELDTARNDLAVAKARIKVAEKAIERGVENLRITRDRYQEKVGTASDVVDAQTLLTQTRTDLYQSIFDFEVAAARVKRATGEL